MRAIVADLLVVACSPGGDGGRKSLEIPTQTARRPLLVSDCRTIAIYVVALVQRAVGIALGFQTAPQISLAIGRRDTDLGFLARLAHDALGLAQEPEQLVLLALERCELLPQKISLRHRDGVYLPGGAADEAAAIHACASRE